MMRLAATVLAAVVWTQGLALFAQPGAKPLQLNTGKEIFQAGCVGCHGTDGKGAPQAVGGFERPATFPDFTDCPSTTPEPNSTWKAIIAGGGPARGFSQIMPSFSQQLSSEQIDKVVGYLRGLCTDKAWPRGEMNLPRAIATEKAFPEDEAVLTSSIDTSAAPSISNELAYEYRFGVRNQLELAIPFAFNQQGSGSWFGGIGDVGIGVKRVLHSNIRTGSIFGVQGEIVLPTGNHDRGLGTGTTAFAAFASYGQILPRNNFLQMQGGTEQPLNTARAPRSAFLHSTLGHSFGVDRAGARMWSPMLELLADRDFEKGAKVNWDLLPEFQVTLSKRQHIRADVGVRVPVNERGGRSPQVVFYLLWDWFDGGLFEGWR